MRTILLDKLFSAPIRDSPRREGAKEAHFERTHFAPTGPRLLAHTAGCHIGMGILIAIDLCPLLIERSQVYFELDLAMRIR